MTDLQITEKIILEEFLRVCKMLDLEYYLVCGSALGAIKYRGFIPWDDDVDVALKRSDYELLLKKAPDVFSSNFLLVNTRLDSNCPFIFTKLCKRDTTYIETSRKKIEMNHFLGIDIFPLDGYPDGVIRARLFELKKKHYERRRWIYNINENKPKNKIRLFASQTLHFVYKLLFPNVKDSINKYEKLLKKYELEYSALWCNYGNSSSKTEYAPREQYGEGTWATFEGLKVRIPERYDDYLTQKYGNWRADLPEDQKVGHHYAEVIDLHRPYTDYIVKLKKGKIRLKTSEELLSSGITPPEGYKY